MKVLVLNGSPKGKYSITVHTSQYVAKKFPEHEFPYLHVGQRIKSFEKYFQTAADAIEEADASVRGILPFHEESQYMTMWSD